MRRIMWFKIGGQTVHLLKLLGIFVLVASLFMVGSSSYNIFLTASKAEAAQYNSEKIDTLFGWSVGGAPGEKEFEFQDFVGVMMAPLANFFFWLGIATLALMLYQSGKIIFPVEEFEQRISDHHSNLIKKAVDAHRKRK